MTLLTMPDEASGIDGTLGFRVSNEARLTSFITLFYLN